MSFPTDDSRHEQGHGAGGSLPGAGGSLPGGGGSLPGGGGSLPGDGPAGPSRLRSSRHAVW